MACTFKNHNLTPDQRLWISEACRLERYDERIIKVRLLGKIAADFDPTAIDHRLWTNGELTLIGRWHMDQGDPVFDDSDRVAQAVRAKIVDAPGIDTVTATEISAALELDDKRIGLALHFLGQLGGFVSSGTRSNNEPRAFVSISLTGDKGYDAYLNYRGIEHEMERFYVSRGAGYSGRAFNSLPLGALELLGHSVELAPAIKQNTAFVLMAIDPARPELEDVYVAIKEVCKTFGISALRADEIQHQDQITDVILREISTCEFLIADLSLERPNVYYEVGYAHAKNKKPILFRRAGTRLHFDLSVHNVPEYRNATHLRGLMNRRFENILGRAASQPTI